MFDKFHSGLKLYTSEDKGTAPVFRKLQTPRTMLHPSLIMHLYEQGFPESRLQLGTAFPRTLQSMCSGESIPHTTKIRQSSSSLLRSQRIVRGWVSITTAYATAICLGWHVPPNSRRGRYLILRLPPPCWEALFTGGRCPCRDRRATEAYIHTADEAMFTMPLFRSAPQLSVRAGIACRMLSINPRQWSVALSFATMFLSLWTNVFPLLRPTCEQLMTGMGRKAIVADISATILFKIFFFFSSVAIIFFGSKWNDNMEFVALHNSVMHT